MSNIKITDFLDKNMINLDLKSKTKNEVIKELMKIIQESDKITSPEKALNGLFGREELGTTGIGKGVAIPHAKTDAVTDLLVGFGISKEGINYGSMDEEPVKIFFIFLSPLDGNQEYLKILARISRLIREDKFRNSLLAADTPEKIIEIINNEES
jgi:PTS system nitrogen regulatory IIA component